MRDHLEKYISLQKDFANKAGWLMQVYEQQLRICNTMSRSKIDQEQKKLILSCIETHKTASDLCTWSKNFIEEMIKDIDTAIEGAKMRNVMDEQSQLLKHLLDDTSRKDKTAA